MNKILQPTLGIEALKQQLEDTRLRLALLEYQQQEDEARQAARDSLPPDSPEMAEESSFFARTQTNTLRLIKKHERLSLRRAMPRRFPRVLTVAAAVLLLLALSLGTALAVSPALRVQVMRLLYQVTPEYTQVSFVPDEAASFDVPAEWTGLYYPAYIPEGYEFYGVGGSSSMPKVLFNASEDRFLRFSEYSLEAESNINSEGYTVEEADINDTKGVLSWKDGHTILVWPVSDRFFILDITAAADTAMEIARSVTRVI